MSKRFFTTESLASLINEIKSYVSNAVSTKAESNHLHDISDVTDLQIALNDKADAKSVDEALSTKQPIGDYALKIDYNESIIGLSVDGQVVTYIKGDGSVHTIITQDTDTTYSLGTDEVTGLTKLYATTGSAEDGTMTQKAIKTELDKKVGVSIDGTQDMLVFTI